MTIILREIEDARYWDNEAYVECKFIYPNLDLYFNTLTTILAIFSIYSFQVMFASLFKKTLRHT